MAMKERQRRQPDLGELVCLMKNFGWREATPQDLRILINVNLAGKSASQLRGLQRRFGAWKIRQKNLRALEYASTFAKGTAILVKTANFVTQDDSGSSSAK